MSESNRWAPLSLENLDEVHSRLLLGGGDPGCSFRFSEPSPAGATTVIIPPVLFATWSAKPQRSRR